jgi:beta-glucosidase
MTLAEKIDYLGGDREFFIRPVERLKIPEIKMSDGPAGCRNWGPNTTYPAAVALAASYDTALVEQVGRGIGRDCRARGVHILLAPGMNIARTPLNGRNFEYYGEDPLLAGKTATAFIRGVQGEGVLCTAKHFAGNNQEWDRGHVSSEIDERTLREIYFPAFERAVREGHVASVMTAYNLLNGTYCSHHAWLLRTVLKKEWDFGGFVMSDWGAAHDTLGAAQGGLDLEMPRGRYFDQAALVPLVNDKKIDVTVIDDKVRRILRTIVAAGFLDRTQKRDDVPLDDPSSAEQARRAARESLVLLKNRGSVLPFDRSKIKRIAVIGPNAYPAVTGGSGSAFVTPLHAVSLVDGVKQAAPGIEVLSHPGVGQSSGAGVLGKPCFTGAVEQTFFAGRELEGSPIAHQTVDRVDWPAPGAAAPAAVPAQDYSIRWTGTIAVPKRARYRFMTNADDGIRVLVDQKRIIEDWKDHAPETNTASVDLAAGKHAVSIEYYQHGGGAVAQFGFSPENETTLFQGGAEITALAHHVDAVVVSVGFGQSAETNSLRTPFPPYWPPQWARRAGLVESEDSDRPFELPLAQLETIRLVAAANPNTVVVVNAGGAVDVASFLDKVPALLWAWYPGQEGGRAEADVLFGDVSPSGKLPVTFAKRYADYPSAPYYAVNVDHKTPYTEGVFVGYRGFDANDVAPAFPFGHGLSYTTFAYSDLDARAGADGSAEIKLTVANTGKRAGDEIVEAYVAPPKTAVRRPPKELEGYARVSLAPGERKEVAIALEPRAFAFWDDAKKQWTVEAGSYQVLVGSSSRDIRVRTAVDVASRAWPP